MFRLNISQKFIAYLIGISIIPLLIVGVVSSRISANILQEEASLYTTQIVNNQRDYLDLQLSQVEDLITNLSGVDEIRNVIENGDPESTFSILSTQAKMGVILSNFSHIDGLVSIDIFTISGAHYSVGDTLDTTNIQETIRDEIFEQTLESEDFVTWIGIEDNVNASSSYKKVVTAARVLYIFNQELLRQEPIALILVNYSVQDLHEHFSNINLGENAYMLVLDSHNHFIYHPDLALQGETASEDLLGILSGEHDTSIATIDGIRMSISHTHSNISDWSIVSLVPIATLNAQAAPIQESIIFILLICFIVVGILAWFYNRSVVFPIRKITHKYQMMQKNASNPQNHHVAVQGNDEIAELGRWFNTFIDILVTKELNEDVLRENLTITSILYESGKQIIDIKHLPTLLQTIAENFVDAIRADRVSLILFDTETERINHFYTAGSGTDKIATIEFKELTEGLSGWVLKNGVTALSPKGEPDPRENAEVQQRRIETNCGSIMVVPLKYGGKIYGTVTAINRPEDNDFTQKDTAVMVALANQAIIAIENTRLVQSLRESEEKFFTTFHASPDQMAITERESRTFIDVNDSFLKLTQSTREEVIGRSPEDLGKWSNIEGDSQYLQNLSEQGMIRNYEATFEPHSGDFIKTLLVSAEIIELNGEMCNLTIAKDITKSKEMEQQRIQFALEHERMQILSGFITEASHEFRTPLAIINTNSYLLKKMTASEKQHKKLDTIQRQIRVITTLVDSLSLMTKIDSGGHDFQHETFDLNNIISTLEQAFEEELLSNSIDFSTNLSDTALIFEGDENFIKLAVQNCLENAIQYTNKKGHISLRIIQDNHKAIIEIQDSGIGISEEEQNNIFKRFYQADKSGTMRGFGLGLPITKAIVEHYGGQIVVESIIGKGSTFRLNLPILKASSGK